MCYLYAGGCGRGWTLLLEVFEVFEVLEVLEVLEVPEVMRCAIFVWEFRGFEISVVADSSLILSATWAKRSGCYEQFSFSRSTSSIWTVGPSPGEDRIMCLPDISVLPFVLTQHTSLDTMHSPSPTAYSSTTPGPSQSQTMSKQKLLR